MKFLNQPRFRSSIFLTLLLPLLVFIFNLTINAKTLPISAAEAENAICRYGATPVDTHIVPDQIYVIPTIGAGWYLTFASYEPDPPPSNGAEFAHIIYTKQVKSSSGAYLPDFTTTPTLNNGFANTVKNNPGHLWLVGNEVDRGPAPGADPSSGQGDMMPDMYATAYYNVYRFIKEQDPTARVAMSALVQVTPGRLQYLDLVWYAYLAKYCTPMPVDVWNMHLYILPEAEPDGTANNIANIALGTDPALAKRGSGGSPANCANPDVYCYAEHDNMAVFAEQVVSMRQWMKAHGQQNKPLIISEYSILYPYIPESGGCFLMDENGNCFTPERVSAFMLKTFDYLSNTKNESLGYPMDENRLVQQWMWFAIHTKAEGSASNITEADLVTLTLMGRTFRDHVAAEKQTKNFAVEESASVVAKTNGGAGASAEIATTFRNNGNVAVDQSYRVTFYKNAGLTQPIGFVTINPGLRGCATVSESASVIWTGLQAGVHQYWVKVDSEGSVGESNEGDNVSTGFVFVNPEQVMLPMIRR